MLKRKLEENEQEPDQAQEHKHKEKKRDHTLSQVFIPVKSTSYLLLLPYYGNNGMVGNRGNRGKESWTLSDASTEGVKTAMRKCVKDHWTSEWKSQMSELIDSVQVVNYHDGHESADRCARHAVVLMFGVGNRELLLVFDEYSATSWTRK